MFKIKSRKSVLFLAAAIAVIIILVIRGCNKESKISYEYGDVDRGAVEKTISVSGKLELYDSIIVKSEIPGEIIENNVVYNDKVSKGQLLLRIKSDAVDDAYNSYKSTYTVAKNDLDNYRQFLKIQKKLYDELLISKKEYDEVRLTYDRKYSTYEDVLEQYNNRAENVKKKNVYSPVSGIVIQSYIEEKSEVAGNTPLFLISTTLKKMKLTINIDEADIGFIKNGQKLTFTVSAYPDNVFSGEIKQVRMNPTAKQSVVTYEALVECENNDELLRPGMTVTATVDVNKKENVLRVQNQALLVSPVDKSIKPGEKFVWVYDKKSGKELPMREVPVVTGLYGDTYTEIVSGELSEKDKVLIGIHVNAVK
ncbi:MAG: efflux RND transporter periplasmic adaptor subunit [Spirochaetes bacterium]|nr:efflux RND transporter periplasmic adaptor subunit [Spirochaetota bacterium]